MNDEKINVLVLGASTNPERYSNKAITELSKIHVNTYAVGNSTGRVGTIPILTAIPDSLSFHTVTLYLSPQNQKAYYDQIIALRPQRVIFNPGTENPELALLLQQHSIETEIACTLVLINTNQFLTK